MMFRSITHVRRQLSVLNHFEKAQSSCCFSTQSSRDGDNTKDSRSQTTQPESGYKKPFRNIDEDLKRIKSKLSFWRKKPEVNVKEENDDPYQPVPQTCDVLIVGGGAIGSSVAYWLLKRVLGRLNVIVVERDPTYKKSSSILSVGGLRQQFTLEENIRMSLFGAEFLRKINEYLVVDGEPSLDVQFHPCGYLFLASEAGAEILEKNSKLQVSLGARNELLSADMLKSKFPWLNTDGIALGCHGLEQEGWFDPWTLLFGLKRKAIALGAEFVPGEVTGFNFRSISNIIGLDPMYDGLESVTIRKNDGEVVKVQFSACVIAAGAFSADVAKMAKVGRGRGILNIPLPVEPRKRFVYCFHCPDGPGLNTPLTIDTSGTYFRREGLAGYYLCGRSPELQEDEPPIDSLDVDHDYFNEHVWPQLAHRVKAFENLKVNSSWAGYYEQNTFDANGIIGPHPFYSNLYIATGFSGHGIQQAPAVGRAISELILDKGFRSLDLTRLGFHRLFTYERMKEQNLV